jgi:hypothetical protein
MKYDTDKVDDAVLALMYLNTFKDEMVTRTWKDFDWDSMNRLHEKNYIHNPVGKTKSVSFTPEGLTRAETLFKKYFVSTN